MTVKLIIATDENYAIGKDNSLLWYIPEDLAYFKEQTKESAVIMGRKTFESLPCNCKNGLPNRYNIVLSQKPRLSAWLCKGSPCYISDVSWLVNSGFNVLSAHDTDTWVIGGASVYEQFKDIVEEVHWTTVHDYYPEADTYFDMSWVLDEEVFEKVSEKELCDEATVSVYKRKLV